MRVVVSILAAYLLISCGSSRNSIKRDANLAERRGQITRQTTDPMYISSLTAHEGRLAFIASRSGAATAYIYSASDTALTTVTRPNGSEDTWIGFVESGFIVHRRTTEREELHYIDNSDFNPKSLNFESLKFISHLDSATVGKIAIVSGTGTDNILKSFLLKWNDDAVLLSETPLTNTTSRGAFNLASATAGHFYLSHIGDGQSIAVSKWNTTPTQVQNNSFDTSRFFDSFGSLGKFSQHLVLATRAKTADSIRWIKGDDVTDGEVNQNTLSRQVLEIINLDSGAKSSFIPEVFQVQKVYYSSSTNRFGAILAKVAVACSDGFRGLKTAIAFDIGGTISFVFLREDSEAGGFTLSDNACLSSDDSVFDIAIDGSPENAQLYLAHSHAGSTRILSFNGRLSELSLKSVVF
jgi:hypothetical protein